jgi:hypothetical protein
MTAEVAILNRSGIALAADSAVTVGGKKIFNSVNKLFELSKDFPVGIMIYSGASIMGIPWETIIKVYRKQLKNKSFPELHQYVDDFIEYLATTPIFTEEIQKDYASMVAYFIFSEVKLGLDGRVEDLLASQDKVDSDDINRLLIEEVNSYRSNVENFASLDFFDKDWISSFVETYGEVIDRQRLAVFENVDVGSDGIYELKLLMAHYFGRDYFERYTGIVIAGFGEEDIFPRLQSFSIECKIGGKLKIGDFQNFEIDHSNNTAMILPFAQHDMILTFCQSINPKLRKEIFEIFEKLTEETVGIVRSSLGNGSQVSMVDKIGQEIQSITEKIKEGLSGHIGMRYTQPLLNAVASLPPPDLAEMAGTLINLTSFKKRVSHDMETVGGPADVALITKGEGFIWINRKHFFESKLNPNFGRRNNYS